MRRTSTPADLSSVLASSSRPRAVVMTMGALHEGHLRLVDAARDAVGGQGTVVVTIFVNPLQFGEGEDFEAYPRPVDDDLAALELRGGTDVVFTPAVRDLYPHGRPEVTIDPGPLAAELEGAVRPGHFAGALTVVLKLLHLTGADMAMFGEKDYQQLTLIRRMVSDLDVPVEVRGVPTVREKDGLALSSRNRYLGPDDRRRAAALSRALAAGVQAAVRGPQEIVAAARAELAAAGIAPDYVELRSVDLRPVDADGPARLLLAARVGPARLIDNAAVELTTAGKATRE